MTTDPYLNAYETAMTELARITKRFDQLRTRKSHVENLIVVLQQTLDPNEFASTEMQATMEPMSAPGPQENPGAAAEQDAGPESYSFLEVPSPSPLHDSSGDPFQRKIRSSFRFRGISAQRSY